jgi:AP-4 complex subunit beta-1
MSSAEQGGMSLNRGIVLQLLRRIDSFNEWGLCQVLSIVSRYSPADEDEGFSIMNLLDPVSINISTFHKY